jgi:hypothetical protein
MEADKGAAEVEESLMQLLPALVADRQAAVAVEPGEGALHHPAVPPQVGLALHALAGDAALDAAAPQVAATATHVVALVGVQLLGPSPPPTVGLRNRRDTLDQRFERGLVGAIRPGQPGGEREAPPVGQDVMLTAFLAPIRGVLAGRRAPLLAGTLALSRQARDQSILSASPSLSSSA